MGAVVRSKNQAPATILKTRIPCAMTTVSEIAKTDLTEISLARPI